MHILSSSPVILLRGAPLNIVIWHEVLFSNKGTNWKFIFPWRKINWHVLQIPKAHFSYLIWLMICGKSIIYAIFIMVMHLPSASANKAYKTNCLEEFPILLPVNYYTYMCTYKFEHVYTYKKNEFQNILESQKIMHLVWAVVTGLILNMKLNMIWIMLMEFACIKHSWTLQQMNLKVFVSL